MNTTLVFMAAGFGSRFGGGVKQIEPVGPHGEVLMDYAVHDALSAGFNRVVFIIRRDIEKEFRDGVGKRTEKKCDVEYVYQDISDIPEGFSHLLNRKKPWGTGQAVLACRDIIHDPFCVLNADDYYGPEAFQRIHKYISEMPKDSDKLDLCMAGYVLGNTLSESGAVTRGLCQVNHAGKLVALRETKGIVVENGAPCVMREGKMQTVDPSCSVSMNIWGMPAAFIGYLQEQFVPFLKNIGENALDAEFLLPAIIGEMIQEGRGTVRVLPTTDKWFGMTYMQDKLQTQRKICELIASGVYPERM